MKAAVKELDFIMAAQFRDEIFALRERLEEKK
jgi:excinuclease UvrABC helicase subunit UvrB